MAADLRDSVSRAAGEASALVRKLESTQALTAGGVWTVRETAVHLVACGHLYASLLAGEASPLEDRSQSKALNSGAFLALAETRPAALADLIGAGARAFLDVLAGVPPAQLRPWHYGREVPALKDEALTEILAGIYEPGPDGRRPPECLYGSLKMWEHLNRQGITVAKCTVERLMRANGWRGVTRGRTVRTTIPDPAHTRAPDLVKRHFTAGRPGQLHVADFTYVPLDGSGFGYTAFVIDAFAGLIAGWECSLSKETALVERAIRQAAALRAGRATRSAGRPSTTRRRVCGLGYQIRTRVAGSSHSSSVALTSNAP